MRFIIVTGMSGAGKSTALKMFEDNGYYCVDNLPIPLIEKFAELAVMPGNEIDKVVLGVDARNGRSFKELCRVLDHLKDAGYSYEILFFEANDDVLVKRYKETRRTHPLAAGDRLETGIARERERLSVLKGRADYIIDTSRLLTRELKAKLEEIFVHNEEYCSLYVTILSFGFKYGIPSDSDLVFDVRFLPNPFYFDELKYLTGNDAKVQEYVLSFEEASVFLDKLEDMVNFLLPNYVKEGKNQLVISVGCTGGKHRSVTIANELHKRLSGQESYGLNLVHRDVEKDRKKA